MKQITIFEDTHKNACLDGAATINDEKIYDANVSRYFDYLKNEAEKFDFQIDIESGLSARSYYVDDDDAEGHDFMLFHILDFWRWYN